MACFRQSYCSGENEHLYGPTPSHVPFKAKIIQENLIHASRYSNTDGEEETRKSRTGRGHWVTDSSNFELNELSSRSVQFRVFGVSRVALLVKEGSFLI